MRPPRAWRAQARQPCRQADNDAWAISPSSMQLAPMQLAFGLGPVEAERIELRDLMQEAFLRRDRYDHAAVRQQNRLAKLQVPIAQRQSLALEGGDGKIRPFEKVEHRFWISGIFARHRLTYHACRGPCLHVQRRHMPRIQLQKAVLHLYRAPLVLRGVPAFRNQAGGSRDRPRVPGSIGQVRREYLTLVCGDENVIGGSLLGEHGHLTLDQGHAAIGATRTAAILEYA